MFRQNKTFVIMSKRDLFPQFLTIKIFLMYFVTYFPYNTPQQFNQYRFCIYGLIMFFWYIYVFVYFAIPNLSV